VIKRIDHILFVLIIPTAVMLSACDSTSNESTPTDNLNDSDTLDLLLEELEPEPPADTDSSDDAADDNADDTNDDNDSSDEAESADETDPPADDDSDITGGSTDDIDAMDETTDGTEIVENAEQFTFNLTVSRHVDTPFDTASVDAKLADASSILQTVETECPDLATDVTFTRAGDVTTFDIGDGVLTSEAQLDAVFSQAGDFKLVTSMVGVCGITSPDDMTIILGCAFTGGSVVIIPQADADVWAHEWGHVQGLLHRDNCPRNIMHSFEILTNAVNDFEREAFLTPTPGFGFFGRTSEPPAQIDIEPATRSLRQLAGETEREWLERVVDGNYLAGVPATALQGCDRRTGTDALLDMLHDAHDDVRKRNIVRALGLMRDERACLPLIDSLSSATGEMTQEELNTSAEMLLALGRLAASDQAQNAITFLINRTDPAQWQAQDLALARSATEAQPLDDALARIALMALGLSGDDAAGQHLSALSDQLQASRLHDPWYGEQVREALLRFNGHHARVAATTGASPLP